MNELRTVAGCKEIVTGGISWVKSNMLHHAPRSLPSKGILHHVLPVTQYASHHFSYSHTQHSQSTHPHLYTLLSGTEAQPYLDLAGAQEKSK